MLSAQRFRESWSVLLVTSNARFWRTAGASGMTGMRALSCRMSVAERAAALGHMGYAFARRPNGSPSSTRA
jgi:hypothetical protein